MTDRRGFALVFALLVAVVLSLVGLALMTTGAAEAMITETLLRQLRARSRAEAAAVGVLDGWSTRAMAVLPAGSTLTFVGSEPPSPGGDRVRVTRLDRDLYLVRTEARYPPDAPADRAAVGRAGLLIRTLPLSALERALPAALTAGTAVDIQAGVVRGEDGCGPAVPGVFAPSISAQPDAIVTGDPPVHVAPAPPTPAPDPLSLPLAAALASTAPAPGLILPRPVADGGDCIIDDRNWGALDPHHPCHDRRPFVHVDGPVIMMGGEGQGVLIAEGDVHLTDGARFHGILIVRGHLVIDGGSVVEGAVRAGSATLTGGTIRRDACLLSRVLSDRPLNGPFRPPERWWVPHF